MTQQVKIDPAVLQQAAKGIQATIGELSSMGIGETGNMGRGFSLLTLSTMEAGKHTVQKTFEEFTERWSWGVRALVQAGNSIAKTLGLAAGRYHEMDAKAEGMLKKMWTHLAGNPHLTDEQITKRSWGDTFADNSFNHIRNADYSMQSFEKANKTIQTNFKVIEAVGPQAFANISPVTGSLLTGQTPGWNTGASEQAAKIMKDAEGK
ncbi:type VII secretion target [Nocardia sp. XZ_19_369]|uniref:type VII secretion target n=1 Tax=Nocardia sp. XZ_19_369 TaxID=2769487 RepID=UPI00188F09D4|nr:type VII secretion target [Nocardia sp. XZ_19_369]